MRYNLPHPKYGMENSRGMVQYNIEPVRLPSRPTLIAYSLGEKTAIWIEIITTTAKAEVRKDFTLGPRGYK